MREAREDMEERSIDASYRPTLDTGTAVVTPSGETSRELIEMVPESRDETIGIWSLTGFQPLLSCQ